MSAVEDRHSTGHADTFDKEVFMSPGQMTIMGETTKGSVPAHQPCQSAFRAILSEDIDWKPFAAFLPSVRLAVVVGQPSEPGPYVIRVRVPAA